MNYGTYRPTVRDIYVGEPLHLVLNTLLKKRVRSSNKAEVNGVYKQWVSFLKKKTLLDEYMVYTSLLAGRAVEFDTYDRIHEFCEEYGKFRLVFKKGRLYVNWLELYDEFNNTVKNPKKPFWSRIFGVFGKKSPKNLEIPKKMHIFAPEKTESNNNISKKTKEKK